jgi:riboflavin-specific deaminase-like protein
LEDALSQPDNTAHVVERVLADLGAAEARRPRNGRPFVTLAWAQSLDGSLALEAGKRYALSGARSLGLTHALRAAHDSILVGIGTLLADDPALTVRHWQGPNPGPVVLDSQLRTPPGARVLTGGARGRVRIACTDAAEGRHARLAATGAEVLQLPAWANGWVDLAALLEALGAAGVGRVMVEGGARVLTSFLRAELADYAVVTVTPRLLGGLHAVGALERPRLPRLANAASHGLGEDVVLAGALAWGEG